MKENKKIPHRIRSLAEHLALKKGKEADKEDIAEVEKKLSSMNFDSEWDDFDVFLDLLRQIYYK